jgi:hypothetical protein
MLESTRDPVAAYAPRKGTRTQIATNLYLGDRFAAARVYDQADWAVIDVREGWMAASAGNVFYRPILDGNLSDAYASPTRLEAACEAIDTALAQGKQVLVHCWMGMERSPLTIVYWLHTRQGMSISQAYAFVKLLRNVYDRRHWLLPLEERRLFEQSDVDYDTVGWV